MSITQLPPFQGFRLQAHKPAEFTPRPETLFLQVMSRVNWPGVSSSTMSCRLVGEWRYDSTHSWPRLYYMRWVIYLTPWSLYLRGVDAQ